MSEVLSIIELDKNSTIEFEMQMDGAVSGELEASLVVITPAFNMQFKANIDGDNISISIPAMNGILIPMVYKFKLVFLVGNNYYVPLEGSLEFTKPFTVSANIVTKELEAPINLFNIKPKIKVEEPIIEEDVSIVATAPDTTVVDSPNILTPDQIADQLIANMNPDNTVSNALTQVKVVKSKTAGSLLKRLSKFRSTK